MAFQTIDDILVTGEMEEDHFRILDALFSRLEEAGLKLKQKCAFVLNAVEYLGHCISGKELHPTVEKVKAIAEAPQPQNVHQLCSFLGLVNYYGKFLPQLSSMLLQTYKLLQKQVKWTWGSAQKKFHAMMPRNS